MTPAIGIDLGGTRIKALAYDLDSDHTITTHSLLTRDGDKIDGSPAWRLAIRELVADWEAQWARPAEVIGLSTPGLSSKDASSVACLPVKLKGIENFSWTNYLGRDDKVTVLNDAHAALLGEIWKGAAQGLRNVLLLTLGTGVGGAAMIDGQILKGHIGRGGHFGHISLDPEGPLDAVQTPGSLEDAIGECTLPERSDGSFSTTEDLIEAYLNGNYKARVIFSRSVRALAAGVCSLINVLDPEVVLLGGGITCAGDNLLTPLCERLDEIEWRPNSHKVQIRIAENLDWAGAYGALHRALELNKKL